MSHCIILSAGIISPAVDSRQEASLPDPFGDVFPIIAGNAPKYLLYAGEQFDIDAQQYYLRARYYDPLNGRFNRTDPFAGKQSDPQSLHKYLYCHANPVSLADPSGDTPFLLSVAYTIIIVALLVAVIAIPLILLSRAMAPRGHTLYVNFSNFDVSGVKLADGSTPIKAVIKEHVLKEMAAAFDGAGIAVESRTADSSVSWKTPELSFTDSTFESRDSTGRLTEVVWGDDRIGGTKGKIHLGNFTIVEFNGRFRNNEDLAKAISFLAIHESGHIYKLSHLNQPDNYMRKQVLLADERSVDGTVEAFLGSSRFTDEQEQMMSNVASTGRRQ